MSWAEVRVGWGCSTCTRMRCEAMCIASDLSPGLCTTTPALSLAVSTLYGELGDIARERIVRFGFPRSQYGVTGQFGMGVE